MYAVNLPSVGAEAFKVIPPYLDAARDAASLAMQLSAGGQFQGVEIEYLGELANLDVSPLKASIVKGLLASVSEENVTLVNAALIAEQRGMRDCREDGLLRGRHLQGPDPRPPHDQLRPHHGLVHSRPRRPAHRRD